MAPRRRDESRSVSPVVRVAPLGELKVYMVTEEELEALGHNSPGSVFLNFSLALLPLSAAFLITLLTTNIPTTVALVFFICACLVSALAGLICLVFAWRYHVSSGAVVKKIKNRMPPPPAISQEAAEAAAPGEGASGARATELPPPAQDS